MPDCDKYILMDLETQSAVDLKKEGSRAYLRDDSTRLMSAVFLVGDDICVWMPENVSPPGMNLGELGSKIRPADWPGTLHLAIRPIPPRIVREAVKAGAVFVAHNGDNFDRLAWERFVPDLKPEWYDTIHACRAAGLPAGLDRASKALGGAGKDHKGSRAMQLLCKAKVVKGEPKYATGTPELWAELLRYNIIDVLELKRVFDSTGVTEPDLLSVHRRINDRGIPVDIEFARRLRNLWNELGIQARDEVAELTGGAITGDDLASPVKVKNWMAKQGFAVQSLSRAAIEQMLADPDGFFGDTDDPRAVLVEQVIRARQSAVRTAPGKLDRVLGSADADGRVRGCFVYHGAHTGRWSARDLQPHNFPRGLSGLDIGGSIRAVYDADKEIEIIGDLPGSQEAIRQVHQGLLRKIGIAADIAGGSTGDALSTLMRPIIRAPKGRRLVICDYASVEARAVAWLSRDERLLGAFNDPKRDIYCDMASALFGEPVTKANKDRRQIGKNIVLGCGYQMGPNKFGKSAALQGCDLEKAGVSAEKCVKTYRETYPGVPRMWWAYKAAFCRMVDSLPGSECVACRCTFRREGEHVTITLPSGRKLWYREARMEPIVPVWGGPAIETPTYQTSHGYRRGVYGGYLTENISQAVCRDLLADAMTALEGLGREVVMHVHDEVVCECGEGAANRCLETMLRVMSNTPGWAAGFPLSCEGFVSEHYVKSPLPGFAHGAATLGEITSMEVG